jgi:hypothetical protein
MPVVHNCQATGCSVWGRPVTGAGFVDGPEVWLDELSPGGVGTFANHRAIVIRHSGQDKGPRIAGPSDEDHIYVGATVRTPSPRLWGGAMLLLLLLLVLLVLVARA